MQSKEVSYPFLPKTTSSMVRGMIWDIPLRDGSFACGRVYSLERRNIRKRYTFWGALLDWHSKEMPTAQAIAGAQVLWQGNMDVRTLAETGSQIRGLLPLEQDGFMVPPILTTLMNGVVTLGFETERPATDEEFRSLPVMHTRESNQNFIRIAEEVFLDGKPMRFARSMDDNNLLDKIGLHKPSDLKAVQSEMARSWRKSKKTKSAPRKSAAGRKRSS